MNNFSLSSLAREEPGLLSGQYWAELRIFAEVARAKSFNRAAERLGLSQPTIGRKVRRLQDVIGAQLFVSSKQGVKLTQRGEELAEALLVFDQSLFSIASDLKAKARDAEGLVSISMTDGLAAIFAAPAIARFGARFPKIQIHLKNVESLTGLRENQCDMMLGFVPVVRSDVTCQPLGTLHFLPIAARSYIARHGMPTRQTIDGHSFIDSRLYQSDVPVWQDWQQICAEGRIAHFSDNSFAYAMLVKQGLGIGLLGSYALRDRAAVGLDLGVHAALPMYAIALTERLHAKPVRMVFEWLCDLFGEANRWFASELVLAELPETLPSINMMMGDDD